MQATYECPCSISVSTWKHHCIHCRASACVDGRECNSAYWLVGLLVDEKHREARGCHLVLPPYLPELKAKSCPTPTSCKNRPLSSSPTPNACNHPGTVPKNSSCCHPQHKATPGATTYETEAAQSSLTLADQQHQSHACSLGTIII